MHAVRKSNGVLKDGGCLCGFNIRVAWIPKQMCARDNGGLGGIRHTFQVRKYSRVVPGG